MHPLIKTFYIIFLLASSLVYANEFSNNLKDEDSPYLQQHVHNPVNWYAWNDKALQKAKDEHKLIFLSIGYSTCHWCHVMAKESFEDKNIAQLLNKDYVSIKVDREELPHLDKYYQNLHILLKRRSGGWPLTVILSEEAKAFFVGTYIPAYEKQGWEGLSTILPRLAKDYKQNRTELIRKSVSIENMMRKAEDKEFVPVPIDLSITKEIYTGLQKQFDEIYYGFSIQPKFPESAKISLLFDLNAMGEDGAKEMALKILKAMALHGLYDQTEGGFFRYSTDAAWEIPHFEKMLYTNAELIPLYVKAFELSGEELYKKIVIESIEMIEDRFEDEGLYFSASDADSDHEEGAYFIYNEDEIKEAMKGLRDKERDELIEAMDISEIGNFEDKTHINFFTDVRPLGFSKIKQKLKDIRRKREYPFIDKKINTAWNAMMIEALFYASQLDKNYADLAEFRMEALLNKMYQKGILYHQSLTNKMPKQKALLEDYAFLISALIQAYESTYDDKYLFLASQLSQEAVLKFYDGRSWYLNAEGTRVKADMQDKYYTAPMNKMLMNLLKLSSIKGERKYLEPVNQSLKKKSFVLNKDPSFYPSAMQLILRQKRGFVTLKATKERLLKAKENIRKISYPFILTKKDEKLKNYLACDLKQCFAIENELDEIVQKIDKY